MPPSVPITAHAPGAQVSSKKETCRSGNTATRKKLRNKSQNLKPVATTTTNTSSSEIPPAQAVNQGSSPLPTTTSSVDSDGALPLLTNNHALLGGPNGMYGGGNYGMAMGSPYFPPSYGYGGMMPGGFMPDQAFSGLNRFLFSVQSVIFSLGQAVQIMGMNGQALHQLLDTTTATFERAVEAWKEMRTLEIAAAASESDEDKKKRRRLRALRWAMMVGVSYAVYRVIRRFLLSRRKSKNPYMLGYNDPPANSQMPRYQVNNPDGRYPTAGGNEALIHSGGHYGNSTGGYGAGSYGASLPYSSAGSPFENSRYGGGYGGPYGYY